MRKYQSFRLPPDDTAVVVDGMIWTFDVPGDKASFFVKDEFVVVDEAIAGNNTTGAAGISLLRLL